MGKLIGYARVSKQEQDLQLQIDALLKAGCHKNDVYIDKVSGAKTARPGLDACLKILQRGGYINRMAVGPARSFHAAPSRIG